MKERLDLLLVKAGLAPSREKAKALIMEGCVFVKGVREDKPGSQFPEDTVFEVRRHTQEYVSRGGHKLAKAVKEFDLELSGLICMDIGASTGGFTDCMLQNGAKKVYAVDVGYNQLAWSLRQDPRVVSMERTNIRYLEKEKVPELLDFVSVDVAFISLEKVFPVMDQLMKEDAYAVCLIKPQFEAGREKVGKKGVIKDPAVQEEVIRKVLACAGENHFRAEGLTFSPIKGPEGNIEFLLLLSKSKEEPVTLDVSETVHLAHQELDR